MKGLKVSALAGAMSIILGLAGCSDPEPSAQQTQTAAEQPSAVQKVDANNPFFKPYDTPFQIPPFSEIKEAHYQPAFEQGMRDHLEEVDNIVNNPEAPSFKNTIEALERSGSLLNKVSYVFYNLTGSNTNPELQRLQREMSPVITAHFDKVSLNAGLFDRINAVYQQRNTLELSGEEQRLLETTYKQMVRQGAKLDADKKAKISTINGELAKLTTQFGQNLLAETNGFEMILGPDDLDGLSSSITIAASNAAKRAQEKAETPEDKAKYEGKFVFTPHRSSMYPFLTYSTRRDLREKLYKSYINRGNNGNEQDNKQIAATIAELRAERAALMGYETHADYVLEERMVKTPEGVYNLLMELWKPALARAKAEAADMQAMIKAEGGDFELAGWDWWYYAEKVRVAKYALDEASIKPYLTLDNVLKGAFTTANKLWGLSFIELHDMPTYHPDVRVWEVKDKDGSHLGIFMGDYFTRSSKRGGAWMSNFKPQSNLDLPERPVVVNVCNFPAPNGDTPSLLSFKNMETLFHEFGHGLHGLVTNTKYTSLSGTAGPRDFTEFPAQIMEHWAREPDVLKTFATHYETGEPMPDELIGKLQKAAKFNQGFRNTEYLAASLLDMDWHTVKAGEKLDAVSFEKDAMAKIGLIDQIAPRYRSTYFSHIFAGGYAAGYYGYIHSAVLDSDGFAAFKESGDLYNQDLAQKYRKNILEAGGTEEAMTLYKRFRGREPQIEALLKVRGLDGKPD